jgi:hypothetical protein
MRAATHSTSLAPHTHKRQMLLPSGWWLLPSVLLGTGFWIAAITAVIA